MDEPRVEPVLLEYLGRICTAWSTAEGHLGALLTCLLNLVVAGTVVLRVHDGLEVERQAHSVSQR
jgi:hypothetical protein